MSIGNKIKPLTRSQQKVREAQRTAFSAWLSGASPEQLSAMTPERAQASYGLPADDAARLLKPAQRKTNA